MPLVMEVGLGPGHVVLDGDPLPQRYIARPPQFSVVFLLWPNGWMDQDAMPLGREVDVGPHDIVLDGKPGPPKRSTAPPLFGPCVAKGLDGSRCHLVRS